MEGEDEEDRKRRALALTKSLKNVSQVGRVTHKPRHQYIGTDFRQQVLNAGPKKQKGGKWKNFFKRTTEDWTRQTSELVVAVKTMAPVECRILYGVFAPPCDDARGEKVVPEEYIYNPLVFETMSKSYRRHREIGILQDQEQWACRTTTATVTSENETKSEFTEEEKSEINELSPPEMMTMVGEKAATDDGSSGALTMEETVTRTEMMEYDDDAENEPQSQ